MLNCRNPVEADLSLGEPSESILFPIWLRQVDHRVERPPAPFLVLLGTGLADHGEPLAVGGDPLAHWRIVGDLPLPVQAVQEPDRDLCAIQIRGAVGFLRFAAEGIRISGQDAVLLAAIGRAQDNVVAQEGQALDLLADAEDGCRQRPPSLSCPGYVLAGVESIRLCPIEVRDAL